MTARTGRHAARRPGGTSPWWALLAAGALAVVAVSPTGSTQAGWNDHEEVALSAITTDRVGLSATPVTAPVVSGTRATTSTTVTNTAHAATLEWSPTSVTATAGARTTSAEAAGILAGLTIGYGADCAAPQWSAGATTGATRAVTGAARSLAPGATTTLCQTTTVSNDLVRAYGARTVTLTTTVAGALPGTPQWSAAASMTTDVRVPFPAPSAMTCTSGHIDWLRREQPAQLSWSWAGSTSAAQPAVAAWEVLVQQRDGRWTTVEESVSGTLSASIYRSDFTGGLIFPVHQQFKVRAYPFATNGTVDKSIYVESDQVVSMTREVVDGVRCDDIVANTSTTAVSLGSAS